jgi:cation diffusion facilitator CzcD-associated flavoprotein CzcO
MRFSSELSVALSERRRVQRTEAEAAMGRFVAPHAIIVGGGASGVMLTYQLLQNRDPGFGVTFIEQRREIGRGPAYHTSNPDHLT